MQLRLSGVKPWDGSYPFDSPDGFTFGEWAWLKRYSGYMPLTINEGFDGGDPQLYKCFALIALCRAGRIEENDAAADAFIERMRTVPFGPDTVQLEGDLVGAEDDAGPPPSSSNGKENSTGAASTTSSDTSTGHPNEPGTPALDSSELAPARSGV